MPLFEKERFFWLFCFLFSSLERCVLCDQLLERIKEDGRVSTNPTHFTTYILLDSLNVKIWMVSCKSHKKKKNRLILAKRLLFLLQICNLG